MMKQETNQKDAFYLKKLSTPLTLHTIDQSRASRRQRLDSWSAPRHHSIMKRLLNKIETQYLRLELTDFYILKLNSQ